MKGSETEYFGECVCVHTQYLSLKTPHYKLYHFKLKELKKILSEAMRVCRNYQILNLKSLLYLLLPVHSFQ